MEALTSVPHFEDPIFINVAKGIEVGSLLRMSELVEQVLGKVRYAVLSGPSHAEEVARDIFSGLRQFERKILPDGSEVFKQIPPKLTLVKK